MADRYTVVPVPKLKQSKHRAVAFLRSDRDRVVNAEKVFSELEVNKKKKARELRSRFDYWIDGGTHDRYFHGWNDPEKYRDCFVFKWKDRIGQRMYGFLCHPTPIENPGFQLCVLVLHATKTERETDTAELDRVVDRSLAPSVKAAISKTYTDMISRTKNRWLQ